MPWYGCSALLVSFMVVSWPGGGWVLWCRALVTKADSSQVWVDMPTPGNDTFLQDYSAGGGSGANYRFKRVPKVVGHPAQVGYNQVWLMLKEPASSSTLRSIAEAAWAHMCGLDARG